MKYRAFSRIALAALLGVVLSLEAPAQRLLVSSSDTNSVLAYDANTGAFLGALVPGGSGGLTSPRELRRGSDGRLYVASLGTNSVLRYDYTTGAFIDAFVPAGSGGLANPWGLSTVSAQGDLLVTSSAGPCVLRFDASSGMPLGSALCDGALVQMQGLISVPGGGDLFVADPFSDRVRRYDAAGVFVRDYMAPGSFSPRGISLGPNGNLFATSIFQHKVVQFDVNTGAVVGDFVAANSGGLNVPNDLVFRSNGNLLVTSTGTHSILEYGATGAFVRVLVPAHSGGLSGPVALLLEGGSSGGGPPSLADYGDAPDDIPACEGTPVCSPEAHYPTLYGTTNAPADRTAPFHLPIAVARDCWFGGPRTNEAEAFQPCCDWISEFEGGPPADQDDGPLVLCLDPGCVSGVFVLANKAGKYAAIGCFGPPPPLPAVGFWIYRVGMGAAADPAAQRFINVDVDWNLDGTYGDANFEWSVQDLPFPAPPGGNQVLFSNFFPVLTVVEPCGTPLGWCVGPFWTRFLVSPEPMLASFPNGDWDGSSGATDGYPWGETEDWVVYCDPGSSGGSCGSQGGWSDCNGNGRPDEVDVLMGSSSDFDQNGIPDECQYNDNCSSPMPIVGYGPFPFDTRIMTTGFEGQNESICNQFGTPGIQNDAWYAWTACETGTAILTTCGQTTVDTKVAVYDGAGCPSGSALACNDDTCSVQSRIEWPVVAGAVYTIQLGQYPGAVYGTGTFSISLEGTGGVVSICHPGTDGVRNCPCSNPPGSTGRGCNNSSATGGAVLTASGAASLSADSLVLTSSGERPTSFGVLLQGKQASSTGFVFGQGVRCATGVLKRLYSRSASAGTMSLPGGGDPSVHARSAQLGDPIQPGEHRYVSVYYRDPHVLGGCPATSTFNSTQTLDVTWAP